jgi:hypothetical protein
MVQTFTELFQYLNSLDVLNSLLPFLLIFTIVFAVLQKSLIFGPDKKNINVIVALIMGLAVVLPHIMYGSYSSNYMYVGGAQVPDAVNIINASLPQVSIVIVAIIMVLLMLGIFGFQASWVGGVQGWPVVIALGLVVYIFGNSAGWWTMTASLYWLNDPALQTGLIVLLVFGIIIYLVTMEEGKGMKAGDVGKGIGDVASKLFGGK